MKLLPKLPHALLVSTLLTGACADERQPTIGRPLAVTPALVATTSVKNVRTLAEQLWRAQTWLGGTKGLSGLSATLGLEGSDDAADPAAGGSSRGAARQRLLLPDDQADFDAFMEDISAFLNQRVLVAAQVESKSGTEVTYKMSPDVFCDAEWDDVTACKEVLAGVEVRVRATSAAEGDIDLTVLVGPEQKRAVQFALHKDLLSVVAELEPASDLVNRISKAYAGDDEPLSLTRASGTAGLSMRRLTDDDLELQASVTSPIAVTMTGGGQVASLDVENGSASIDLNVAGDRAVIDLDLGRIEAHGDKSMVVPTEDSDDCVENPDGSFDCAPVEPAPEPPTGTFTLTAGPFAVWVALENDARKVDLTGLVAGPISLSLDDTKVAELTVGDLRPLDVSWGVTEVPAVPEADGFVGDPTYSVDVAFSHAFAASLVTKMAGQPDTIIMPNTSWNQDEELGLHADGEKPAVRVDNYFHVTAGTVTLTSKTQPTVVATAGQCMWATDSSVEVTATDASGDPAAPVEPEPNDHPWHMTVGDQCPEN